MTFVPFKGFGKYGVVHDSPDGSLPLGVWTNARNIRFSGIQMEKMLEPTISAAWDKDADGELRAARVPGWQSRGAVSGSLGQSRAISGDIG